MLRKKRKRRLGKDLIDKLDQKEPKYLEDRNKE